MTIENYLLDFYSEFLGGSMCIANCSGHGDCLNGTCFCEIKFAGSECGAMNLNYHVGLATTYLFVALISFIQLFVSIIMSCRNNKGNCFREALSPTTPKAIYAVVFLAASLRAAYFAVSATVAANWLLSLLTAYYPLLLTGSSLIVCFWAERFHLRNVHFESHRFLSKSFLGFLAFNILTYSILLVQLLLVLANNDERERSYYLNVFNGCYAVLLFIVVVFFLIYGVEVYFKVRGGFLLLSPSRQILHETAVKKADSASLVSGLQVGSQPVDVSQLHQSRLGLVSQASMIIITILFILSDVLGEFWKDKVAVEKRNFHDVLFRVVELGVALWFPCVLWNVNRPDQLWILNPKKLLKVHERVRLEEGNIPTTSYEECNGPMCFICYGSEGEELGSFIQPCDCKGDVSVSHHDCLRRWLQQKAVSGDDALSCGVCKSPYKLEVGSRFHWSSCAVVSATHWLKLCLMIVAIVGIFMSAWAACHILPTPAYKLLVIGVSGVAVYIILKFLGQNTIAAYQQARVSSVTIVSRNDTNPTIVVSEETKI